MVMVDVTADELIARLKAGKVYLPRAGRAGRAELLPQGQPDGAARARLAAHRRPGRGRRPGLPRRPSIERGLEDRAALLCCVGPREAPSTSVRSAARLAGQLAWLARRLRRDAGVAAPAEGASASASCARSSSPRSWARRRRCWPATSVAGAVVARARAQLLERDRRAHRGARLAPWRARWRSGSAELAPDVDLIEVGAPAATRAGAAATHDEPAARSTRSAWATCGPCRLRPATTASRSAARRGASTWSTSSCCSCSRSGVALKLRARTGGAGVVLSTSPLRLLLRPARALL